MVGLPRPAESGMKGVDALSLLPATLLANLHAEEGVKWVGTYLGVCTPGYRDRCFSLGLGIALILRAQTGLLTEAMGLRYGADAVLLARQLEAPAGLHLTIDLEDARGEVELYVDALAHELLGAGGYRSMLYVGAPQPLSAVGLQKLAPDRYWRSGSLVPEPMRRWSVLQLRPLDVLVDGYRIDRDIVEQDAEGATPVLWWPS